MQPFDKKKQNRAIKVVNINTNNGNNNCLIFILKF